MLANAYVDEKKITKILCICNYLIGLCYGKKWLQFCFWHSVISEYRNGIIDFGSQCLVVFLAKQFPWLEQYTYQDHRGFDKHATADGQALPELNLLNLPKYSSNPGHTCICKWYSLEFGGHVLVAHWEKQYQVQNLCLQKAILSFVRCTHCWNPERKEVQILYRFILVDCYYTALHGNM